MKDFLLGSAFPLIVGLAYSDVLRTTVRGTLDNMVAGATAAITVRAVTTAQAAEQPLPPPSPSARALSALAFPIPAGAYVSSPWGHRRDPITRRWTMHGGVDLAAKAGTTVIAAHSGVCHVRFSQSSGWVVRIHSNYYDTEYRHLGRVWAHDGPIRVGNAIGSVGHSGAHCRGDHLHYCVWIRGKPKDPAQFFPDRRNVQQSKR